MKTVTILSPYQCPLCEGADQHNKGCALEGKEHVYVDPPGSLYRDMIGLVDWDETLKLNGVSDETNSVDYGLA